MTSSHIKVGISVGDLSGVGLEVIVRSLIHKGILDEITPIIFGSSQLLELGIEQAGKPEFPYHVIVDAAEARPGHTNILNVWNETLELTPGTPTTESGQYALQSLISSTNHLVDGHIDALVTAPIDKNNIQSEEFKFPGHTEFLAQRDSSDDVLMFLVSDELKIGVVTGHIPVSEISNTVTSELILNKLKLMNTSLRNDFGIANPKIALLGMNPHAGDAGLIGREEIDLIAPTITKAIDQGISVHGPMPADGLFGSRAYKNYDAVLAMYHDQGLIPFKTIAFESGVNFTAGLSFIRTSPDHGTAFDIAGKGLASPISFIEAMETALSIHRARQNCKAL